MDFNSVKSTMNRFHNTLRRGALAAIAVLSAFAFGGIAAAQTDLDGSDLIVTGSGPWNLSYTNSNNSSQSHVVVRDLVNGTRYTYSGALTGNIFVDVTHQTPTNNENRFTLSNTGNSFTGGLAMHNGILFVTDSNQLVSFSGGIKLDNAVFMAYGDCNFDVTIPEGSFGGMCASGGDIVLNQKVTGNGDLVIVTGSGNKVTLNGANDYSGVTSIGTVQGESNASAYLILGADNTLPSTTVVEIGKSQNANYPYTDAASNLDLNGKTQTIAGLYGAGNASITNSAAAVSNLTIDVADGKSYEYSGTISGNSAANLTNLTVTGAGNQTLSGNVTNASIAKSGTGALTLSGGTFTLSSLVVSSGRLDMKEYLTGDVLVNGGVFSPGNSVGTLNVTGNVSVADGKALFEFDSYNDHTFDVLNIIGDGNSFTAGDRMIELYFSAEDPQAWAVAGAEYQLVSDEGFTSGNYDSWLANYTNLFGLTGKADGLYLVTLASPEPGSGVPEPSTWALLILGAFGLLYFRKRK